MPALHMGRRLAAIPAADGRAYSRLIEREAGTLEHLKALCERLIAPILANHEGRTAKLVGDGALIEFSGALDPASAAVAVRQAVADRERERPEGGQILCRIEFDFGGVIQGSRRRQ
jgi:adenylate cyclase